MHNKKSLEIFFFALHIYQFSNALPLYKKIGGKYICRDLKRFFQLKTHLRNLNATPETKTFLNTPASIIKSKKNLANLNGIIISLSNTVLNYDAQKCKSIFIGHGTGDKPYGGSVKSLETYDYHFISGKKHLEKLHDSNVDIHQDKLIKIGNLRFDDYVNGLFDREVESDRLGIVDRSRQNILYAPTWSWGDGTLQKYVYKFSRELTKKYNLIVRPHYQDSNQINKIEKWAKKNKIAHVYFSNPAALLKSDTMADFAISDILISDTSSILYEYLITGNPIIVAVNEYKNLHNMPDELDIMQHVPLFSGKESIVDLVDNTMDDETYREKLKKLLESCFYFNDGRSVDRAINFIESNF
ncbi:MAG: hypothetical protein DWQ05_02895 [Calditrichaeota bacterium]|nr:MAG: hypothetical protein DWQ05_02895 [Calditrichota bacterium]